MAYQPPENQSGSELEYHTDLPVGEILRRTRVHYGLGLSDVERALRIRESLIQAIEENDSANLPGRVYAIGFIRSYSEYLGFDGNQVVQLYKQQSQDKAQPASDLHFPVATNDSQMPSKWIIGGSVAILLLAVIGWNVLTPNDADTVRDIPAVEEVFVAELPSVNEGPLIERDISVPSEEPSEQALSATVESETQVAQVEPAAGTPAPAKPEQEGILLNVVENSWVEIRDETDKPIVSRVLKSGERYFIPNRPNYTMSIGNAAGLEIFVNGQQIPSLGDRGEILKDIQLDIEALSARKTTISSVQSSNSLATP